MTTSRGCRNNNPGNIRLVSGTRWVGQVPPERQTDEEFVQFESMYHGLRALCRTLHTYIVAHKVDTIRGIVERWAPPEENDTENYIIYVTRRTGADADYHLDPERDRGILLRIVRAIIEMESGHACAATIKDVEIEKAALDAGLVPPVPGMHTDTAPEGTAKNSAAARAGRDPFTRDERRSDGRVARAIAKVVREPAAPVKRGPSGGVPHEEADTRTGKPRRGILSRLLALFGWSR